MRKREFKNIEWSLLVAIVILSVIGLVALFSATQNTEYDEFKKQCIWLLVSSIIMITVMLIDYQLIVKVSPTLKSLSLARLVSMTQLFVFASSLVSKRPSVKL